MLRDSPNEGVKGVPFTPIVENQMKKNIDNEMQTEFIGSRGFPKLGIP